MQEGLRMLINLAQLRPSDTSKRLAGWSAYNNVKGINSRTEFKVLSEHFRRCQYIARTAMPIFPIVKVQTMRTSSYRIILNRSSDIEICRMKSKRETTTSGKQVQQTRPRTIT